MTKKEEIKSKRLEKLILDFTKWLDVNSEKVNVEEIKIYWKKLVEDYVFEYIDKVIGILSEKPKYHLKKGGEKDELRTRFKDNQKCRT